MIWIESQDNGAQSEQIRHVEIGASITQTLSRLLQTRHAALPGFIIVLLLACSVLTSATPPWWGCNWHDPLCPLVFPRSSFPRVKKKRTMPGLNQRGLWALCRGIQEVSVSVYSWMCCSAGDSSPASVIKAEGMSSLWTLPHHNPPSWRGLGMKDWRYSTQKQMSGIWQGCSDWYGRLSFGCFITVAHFHPLPILLPPQPSKSLT